MCKTFLKLARMIVQAAEEAEAKRVQQERVEAVRERFRKGVKKQLKASAAEAAADKAEAEEEAVAAELERIRVEQEEASGSEAGEAEGLGRYRSGRSCESGTHRSPKSGALKGRPLALEVAATQIAASQLAG